ncbi:RNA 2',3'-cyclic phosphodiesterase [Draconibacterium halophilum]|uniref:RNA 2',3'-cyclic phosphodiesterase n=1 Tax=Draconibacterium halophilum TaxID=2706887 RepID=A0A6C0RCR2_9BACT|nr:RNA 2',3'-cyclic phosphodiesterase [Draconibacterium halophilum]QIA07273.1 RNA 2',3'-cyclic phosphodiesterase [Draconibacterium halophilum]
MREHIRTFIALKIAPNQKVLELLQHFKNLFPNDRIKWVDTDNFHLTLRFIGNTTREQLYELVDRLELLFSDQSKFQITLKGTDYFKSKNHPRVLFIKLCESEELFKLVSEIESQVVASGFKEEKKTFTPHLTLGRIKLVENRNRFFSLLDEWPTIEYQKIEVAELILFQSILKQTGPEYRPIKTFPLK